MILQSFAAGPLCFKEEKNMLEQLPGLLLPWFAEHRRDLPWRRDREPYHVWLCLLYTSDAADE